MSYLSANRLSRWVLISRDRHRARIFAVRGARRASVGAPRGAGLSRQRAG